MPAAWNPGTPSHLPKTGSAHRAIRGFGSEDDRVHILRNQLHYSPMGALVDESIDLAGRFTEIVRHRNYNPRVIEMTIEAEVRCSGFKSVGPRESGWDCGAESSITGNPNLDMFKVLEDALEFAARLWR